MPAVAGRTFPNESVLSRELVTPVIASLDVVALVESRVGIVEVAVLVANKFPTVSCVPVAMRLPEELVVTMELIGNAAREVSGRLETVRAPEELVNPVPSRLLKD